MNFKDIFSTLSKSAFFLGSLLVLSQGALAEGAKHTLSEFSLGSHVEGPEVDLKSLEGKVVVIDYWGVNCGPCLALMPHIARLDRRYSDKGLVMIAAESQNSPVEAINEIIKKNRLKCCVVKGVRGPSLSNGLPSMAIFSTSGDLVWSGRPGDDADRIIKKELRKVGDLPENNEESNSSANSKLVEMRTWTNADGKTMEAWLRSVDGEDGVFISEQGRKINYPIKKLSQEDQDLIAKALGNS